MDKEPKALMATPYIELQDICEDQAEEISALKTELELIKSGEHKLLSLENEELKSQLKSALKERDELREIVDRCDELLPVLRDIASSYRMQTLDRHGVTLRKMETADEIIAAIQSLKEKRG